jgi:hypothetical protein
VDEEPELDGVSLEDEELDEPAPDDGGFIVTLGATVVLELELDGGVAGVVLDPELELELGGVPLGALLELALEDPGAPGAGRSLSMVVDDEDDAPRFASGPRSQPYRPPTATAMGTRTNTDLFSMLISGSFGGLLQVEALNGSN